MIRWQIALLSSARKQVTKAPVTGRQAARQTCRQHGSAGGGRQDVTGAGRRGADGERTEPVGETFSRKVGSASARERSVRERFTLSRPVEDARII